ncbi:MAG: hypothetical protein ACREIF_14865 [Chthoniobacterales bacterium]
MNDFSELEAELKRLRPAPVTGELVARIGRALAKPETVPTAGVSPRPVARISTWWSLGLGLTGVAALLLLGLGFFAGPPRGQPNLAQKAPVPSTPLTSGLEPSALTQIVYRQHDEGLVFSPNQSEPLLRRVRYDTRETMQWRNPQTDASLRVSYPAEQVVLTPVSFQ